MSFDEQAWEHRQRNNEANREATCQKSIELTRGRVELLDPVEGAVL